MNSKDKTFKLAKMALFISLLSVASYIAVPIPFSPIAITANTLIVNMIAFLFLPGEAVIVILGYIAIGICGLPVFSQGMGGIGKVLSPSGGYLLGYLPAVYLIARLRGERVSIVRYTLVAVLIGIPLINACGMVTMKIYLDSGLKEAFFAAILPYLPGDIIKCLLAAYIATVFEKINFSK